MGGKDSSSFASGRAARDSAAAGSGNSRASSSHPFYRQFLPSQLMSISASDPIPSLDDLSALAKYLTALKAESSARSDRLDSRSSDPLRPIFSGNAHDLFAPPGLSASAISAASLYSDASSKVAKQKSKDRAFNLTSPDPSASAQHPSTSPSSSSKHNRIKVKREREADGFSGAGVSANLYTDVGSASKLAGRGRTGRGQSMDIDDNESVATTDLDWDLDEDSLPSRPGRTYGRNRKRRRKDSGVDSMEEESGSDFENARGSLLGKNGVSSAAGRASGLGSASRRGSEIGTAAGSSTGTPKTSGFGMRLKLNPLGSAASKASAAKAASGIGSPALQRKASDSTHVSTRRNSIMPSPSPHPSTPLAHSVLAPPAPAGPAPGWELPARTPESFIPVLQPSRLPRPYPTHPSEVHENFADKDWRERERERDRLLERESAQPGTPGGPAPGQAIVRETATGRRGGRDQQQTPINTFYNYADAFFKTLTEDDLAWLSSKSDDNEPFQMPALGRHYTKIWEEEDSLAASGSLDLFGGTPSRTPSISVGASNGGLPIDPASAFAAAINGKPGAPVGCPELDIPPPANFKVKQMTDQHLGLGSEAAVDARSGPLAERLVSALLPRRAESVPSMDEVNGGYGNGALSLMDEDVGDEDAEGEPDLEFEGLLQDQDMVGFEERIEKELKAIEVLGPEEKVSVDGSSATLDYLDRR